MFCTREVSFTSGECPVHICSFLSNAAHDMLQLFTASATPFLVSTFFNVISVPVSLILSALSESSGS